MNHNLQIVRAIQEAINKNDKQTINKIVAEDRKKLYGKNTPIPSLVIVKKLLGFFISIKRFVFALKK